MSETALPNSLTEAVLYVRKKIPKLNKAHENKFQGYKFVSIDDFYDQVTPIANDAGLFWRPYFTAWKVMPDVGKNGCVEATVAFDMMWGETRFEKYAEIPILCSLAGAQTTGQVMSYAEKVFMRSAFDVATGEGDADHTDQNDFAKPRRQASAPAPKANGHMNGHGPQPDVPHDEDGVIPDDVPIPNRKNKDGLPVLETKTITASGVETLVQVFGTWMTVPKTKRALRNWFAENVPAVEKLKSYAPEAHTKLMADFKAQSEKLPE